MRNFIKLISIILIISSLVLLSSCSKADKNYGVNTDSEQKTDEIVTFDDNGDPIRATDRVMANYFDITLFDEEHYANIYLGKKFKIDASFAGTEIPVPTTLSNLSKIGWVLAEGNTYDENSLVFSHETIDVVLQNENGVRLNASLFNSSKYSKKLSKCDVVKFKIDNDFYANPEAYNNFNINGITNSMAVTDVINTLGTPSHFYKISETSYYLDYFITKSDRRNGITVYINPVDDLITSIEFSQYK